jgi:salicylate hydroxylase
MFGYVLPEDAPEYNEEWQDQYPLEYFKLDFQKFEPRFVKLPSTHIALIEIRTGNRVRKLFGLAKNFTPHIYISRPHLENFACDEAKVVLVGEAAHPLLVCICVLAAQLYWLIVLSLLSLAGNITLLLESKMRKR